MKTKTRQMLAKVIDKFIYFPIGLIIWDSDSEISDFNSFVLTVIWFLGLGIIWGGIGLSIMLLGAVILVAAAAPIWCTSVVCCFCVIWSIIWIHRKHCKRNQA